MLALSPFWITLGPVVVINAVLVTSFFWYHIFIGKKRRGAYAGAKNQGSRLLDTTTREWWFWTTDPIVRFCVKFHISPNVLTILGVLIAFSSAVLFAYGWFGYAGWAMMFGSSFDMFDGRVARMTGRVSRSGGFFDAVTDRYSEGAVLLGLAIYFHASWMLFIVIASLIGSMLVSYTKARGEAMGISCNVGWMQRPERIVYLGVASIFDPIVGEGLKYLSITPKPYLIIASLIFIAVMTNATALYRMIFVMNALDNEDRRDKESFPQLIAKLTTHAGREELWDRARYGYDRTKSEFSHVILFHAGQVDLNIMKGMISKGELPNVSRHIIERGGMYDAITSFPSVVGPASTAFITGCFPGTCNIPAAKWFDKSIPEERVLSVNRYRDYDGWGAYVMDHDLSKSVRTIFEYSKQAVNIFGNLNRGCGFVRDPAFFRLQSKFEKAMGPSEMDDVGELAFSWFSSAVRRETDLVFYSFPPQVFTGALEEGEEAAKKIYQKLDLYIGKAADVLQKMGMYDRSLLMLSSDCGNSFSTKDFDLVSFLSKKYKVSSLKEKYRDWLDADVVPLLSGTSMAHIYTRGVNGWGGKVFFEEVERRGLVGSLLEKEEVDLIAGRSVEGGIVVQSRRGRASVHEDQDGRVTYLVKASDPFGFESMPQVFDAEEALLKTVNTNYPDALVQLLALFRSRRAGDIVVTASHGISFVHEGVFGRRKATSGSLLSEHMRVPLFSSYKLNSDSVRTVDVFATVIDALGIEPVHSLDGISRASFIHEASEASILESTQGTVS